MEDKLKITSDLCDIDRVSRNNTRYTRGAIEKAISENPQVPIIVYNSDNYGYPNISLSDTIGEGNLYLEDSVLKMEGSVNIDRLPQNSYAVTCCVVDKSHNEGDVTVIDEIEDGSLIVSICSSSAYYDSPNIKFKK